MPFFIGAHQKINLNRNDSHLYLGSVIFERLSILLALYATMSVGLMIDVLVDEEGDSDWRETELESITYMRMQNYLQTQLK